MMREIKPHSLVFEEENALTPEFCQQVIDTFEAWPQKFEGLTGAGVRKDIKDSLDLIVPTNEPAWKSINETLHKNLLEQYQAFIDVCVGYKHGVSTMPNIAFDRGFQIQKTAAGSIGYVPHSDAFGSCKISTMERHLVFIWYLNDVHEGGETHLIQQDIKVKPKAGKIIFFPPYWTHFHAGLPPISNDKYIITGWVCYPYRGET
jgi:hypothetical protein